MSPRPASVTARAARLGAAPVAIGVACLIAVAIAGLLLGAAGLDPMKVLAALFDALPGVSLDHGLTPVEHEILFQIRLPRVVMGGLVGAVLAAAGASYQGVFRNPLVDPYLLGVAAGAGLGATVAFAWVGEPALVAPLAFIGGLLAVGVTYLLGRSIPGRETLSLVLAGVAMASFGTALQTYVLQRNTETLREVFTWILGRLVTVGWGEVRALLPYAAISLAVLVGARRLLDVLGLGDDEATSLGVAVSRVRIVIVLAATLATAAAVSVSGLIGFVGIIVPHTIRLLFGWSYRVILPLSILFGAAFLMAADIAARTVISPAEMPIGVVTAFFGAPFFLLVLRTIGRRR